jgi:hypothetical protein
MYFDSSEAKSTIIEFEYYIVLIEAPIKNEGGGFDALQKDLEDYTKIWDSISE